jgi:hypothetical protein
MAVRRRTLLGLLFGGLAAPLLRLLPRRRARPGRYPGPVEPLDERELRRPGRWLG